MSIFKFFENKEDITDSLIFNQIRNKNSLNSIKTSIESYGIIQSQKLLDLDNNTLLHLAVLYKNYDLVVYLVQNNFSYKTKNKYDETSETLSIKHHESRFLDVFKQYEVDKKFDNNIDKIALLTRENKNIIELNKKLNNDILYLKNQKTTNIINLENDIVMLKNDNITLRKNNKRLLEENTNLTTECNNLNEKCKKLKTSVDNLIESKKNIK
jgi:hypothetical protein